MVIWLRKDNGFPTSMQKWDMGGNCKHADRKLTRENGRHGEENPITWF